MYTSVATKAEDVVTWSPIELVPRKESTTVAIESKRLSSCKKGAGGQPSFSRLLIGVYKGPAGDSP